MSVNEWPDPTAFTVWPAAPAAFTAATISASSAGWSTASAAHVWLRPQLVHSSVTSAEPKPGLLSAAMAASTPPPAPTASPVQRVQQAYAARAESDYLFSFWTALGWTILTCGLYGFYVIYQLVRRSRDH